jgi:hypothetical protein
MYYILGDSGTSVEGFARNEDDIANTHASCLIADAETRANEDDVVVRYTEIGRT